MGAPVIVSTYRYSSSASELSKFAVLKTYIHTYIRGVALKMSSLVGNEQSLGRRPPVRVKENKQAAEKDLFANDERRQRSATQVLTGSFLCRNQKRFD